MRLRLGSMVIDTDLREPPLSPKAFLLLELLLEARPNPVARDTLYQRLWPDVVVEPGNLHTLVSEIRTALGDHDHSIIRTVHRVGYAFAAAGAVAEGIRWSVILGGEEIPLREGENVIGRDARDAVAIHSPEVSRRHARLVVDGATVTLEDLGSKNGTYIGTRRVTGTEEVRAGDDILVGTVRLRLARVDALATTATAT